MSYAFSGLGYAALGQKDPIGPDVSECDDFYSGGLDYCLGYEVSCPDQEFCCPASGGNTPGEHVSQQNDSGWYNWVYRKVKGSTSMRKKRDDKVRGALNNTLLPRVSCGSSTAPSGDLEFDTGVEVLAWDAGDIFIEGGLIENGFNAANHWLAIYPNSRWRLDKTGVKTDCQSDGWYSKWRYKKGQWKAKRMDALSRATGLAFSAATRKDVAKIGWLEPGPLPTEQKMPWDDIMGDSGADDREKYPNAIAPPALLAWFNKATSIVQSLPGNAPGQYIRTSPGCLIRVERGPTRDEDKVVPTDWFRGFIEHFRAKSAAVPGAIKFARLPAGFLAAGTKPAPAKAGTIKVAAAVVQDLVMTQEGDVGFTGGATPSAGPSKIVVAGAAVAAGLAAYLLIVR